MSVLMTSAEAVRLTEALRARADFPQVLAKISERIAKLYAALPAKPDEALNLLLDLGSCVFLENRRCGVYEARPDGCRAALVWHEAWYCGRPEYDQCVPAELSEVRVAEAHRLMLDEMDAGRRPYWGQILPAMWLMLKYGEAYAAAEDLSLRLDRAWVASELIEFPEREQVVREQAEHAAIFRGEPYPLGSPRASECTRREELRPFRLD
jgi:Fe-S-cluster containining protein